MKTIRETIEKLIWSDEAVLDTVGEDIRFVSVNDVVKVMEERESQSRLPEKERIVEVLMKYYCDAGDTRGEYKAKGVAMELLSLSPVERKEEKKPIERNYELAIRLLYRALPCINHGLQDEQLGEDIEKHLAILPDREINSWYCPVCKIFVDPLDVTFEETHDPRSGGCGSYVKSAKSIREGNIHISHKSK